MEFRWIWKCVSAMNVVEEWVRGMFLGLKGGRSISIQSNRKLWVYCLGKCEGFEVLFPGLNSQDMKLNTHPWRVPILSLCVVYTLGEYLIKHKEIIYDSFYRLIGLYVVPYLLRAWIRSLEEKDAAAERLCKTRIGEVRARSTRYFFAASLITLIVACRLL
jgi:hypothetical protein